MQRNTSPPGDVTPVIVLLSGFVGLDIDAQVNKIIVDESSLLLSKLLHATQIPPTQKVVNLSDRVLNPH